MAPREHVATEALAGATRVERRKTKRGLTREGLIETEVTLRESVDGMAQAVSDFERLGQLASSLVQQENADVRSSL